MLGFFPALLMDLAAYIDRGVWRKQRYFTMAWRRAAYNSNGVEVWEHYRWTYWDGWKPARYV